MTSKNCYYKPSIFFCNVLTCNIASQKQKGKHHAKPATKIVGRYVPSIRTAEAYIDRIKRFILFHGKRHPREMGKEEVEAFLMHLAVQRVVAASTQSQAKSALLFLYQQVLENELAWLRDTACPPKAECTCSKT